MQSVERGGCRPHDSPLDLACPTRCDQLAAERTEQRLSDRRAAKRPQPTKASNSLSQERIAREALQELTVVGVQSEREAHPVERLLARRADGQGAVRSLARVSDLEPAVKLVDRSEGATCRDPRRIAAVPGRESE